VFYGLNNIELEAPDDDAYRLVIAIASSAITYEEAAAHLAKWH
jgi:death-on-curing protein